MARLTLSKKVLIELLAISKWLHVAYDRGFNIARSCCTILPARSTAVVSRIPPKYRNVVLAVLVIVALMLPEMRPVRELILGFAAAILIAVAIGFIVSLPMLIPAIRRRGQLNHASRLAGALILGSLAFFVTVVTLTTTLGGRDVLGVSSSGQYMWSGYLLVIGLSLIPAAFCVMFVWRHTRRPAVDAQTNDQ